MTEVLAKTTMHRISTVKWDQIYRYLEETDWNNGSSNANYGSVTHYLRTEFQMFIRDNRKNDLVYECYSKELLTLFILKWGHE
jgi:hypothetical protein